MQLKVVTSISSKNNPRYPFFQLCFHGPNALRPTSSRLSCARGLTPIPTHSAQTLRRNTMLIKRQNKHPPSSLHPRLSNIISSTHRLFSKVKHKYILSSNLINAYFYPWYLLSRFAPPSCRTFEASLRSKHPYSHIRPGIPSCASLADNWRPAG